MTEHEQEVERADSLVGPLRCSQAESEFWQAYEPLVRAFAAHTGPLSQEARFALSVFGDLVYEASWEDDSVGPPLVAGLRGLTGSEVICSLLEGGLMPGFNEAAVVDGILGFLAWARTGARLPVPDAERLHAQLDRERTGYLEAARAEAPDYEAAMTRDESAASFVETIREASGSLELALLAQSLCHDALQRLESLTLEEADWPRLELRASLEHTSRQLPHLGLRRRDLRALAFVFADYLVEQKLAAPKLGARWRVELLRFR